MYTINAIIPLLDPGISDAEAREVVESMSDEQKSIAILALTKAVRDTFARLREEGSESDLYRVLRSVVETQEI